jgi:hypothetical protein
MKEQAKLTDQLAQFLEKNPDIAKFAGYVSFWGAAISGGVTGVSQLLMGLNALKGLGAFGSGTATAAAAGGVATAAGGLTAGAIGAGLSTVMIAAVVAAVLAYMAAEKGSTEVQRALDAGLTPSPSHPLSPEAAAAYKRMYNATKVGPGVSDSALARREGAVEANYKSVEEIKLRGDYWKQEGYILQDNLRQKEVMLRNYNLQERYATEDFNKQRVRSVRDYGIQLAFSEKMFYRQRAIASRDFGIQMVRNEQDFQRSRRRASEDHQFDLFQIALSGDAMQYWMSERQYKIDQARAKEDFDINRNRSNEDFNRQQKDQAEQFQIEREQRAIEFQISLDDQDEDFKIQRRRTLEQYNIQLSDIDYQYTLERNRRITAFNEQLLPIINDEFEIRAEYERRLAEYMLYYANLTSQMIENAAGGIAPGPDVGGGPTYANGGYVNQTGRALVHAGEFYLTRETASQAESFAKGQLSQDTILRMMMGGGGQVTYNDQRQFDSRVSAEDRRAIQQDTVEVLRNLLS